MGLPLYGDGQESHGSARDQGQGGCLASQPRVDAPAVAYGDSQIAATTQELSQEGEEAPSQARAGYKGAAGLYSSPSGAGGHLVAHAPGDCGQRGGFDYHQGPPSCSPPSSLPAPLVHQ